MFLYIFDIDNKKNNSIEILLIIRNNFVENFSWINSESKIEIDIFELFFLLFNYRVLNWILNLSKKLTDYWYIFCISRFYSRENIELFDFCFFLLLFLLNGIIILICFFFIFYYIWENYLKKKKICYWSEIIDFVDNI